MASQTQFKQQCPSCEAMVPIKDTSLVGKKVDCPKCKYRFVVEDPGEVDNVTDDTKDTKTKVKTKPDAAKLKSGDAKGKSKPDADNGRPKKKKKDEKKGPPVMLIAGIGLGLVAVIGLVVGAILLFGGGDEKPSGGSNQQQGNSNTGTSNRPNTPTGGSPMTGGSGSPMMPGNMNNPNAHAGNQPTPVRDHAASEITNLLPNETQAVYSVNVKKFLESSIGGASFRSSSGFRPEVFREGLGLPINQISHFVRAESLKNNWVFNVIQMFPAFGVKAEALKAKLGEQKGPKSPISGHEYFLVSANDTMNSLSAIDFFSIFNPKASPNRTVPSTAMAWHVYDEQTVIIAEVNQMEQFLQGGRKPKRLTQTQESQPRGPMGGFNPMGGFSPMGGGLPSGAGVGGGNPMAPRPGAGPSAGGGKAPNAGAGGAGGASPPALEPPGVGGAGGVGAPPGGYGGPMGPTGAGPMGAGGGLFTDKPSYLTINPELKQMMDKMEEAREPVILSCAGMDLESASQKIVDNIRNTTTLGALIPLPTIVSAGLGLHTFSESRVTAVAAVELRREDDARALHETIQGKILERATSMLGKWMNVTFESANQSEQQSPFGPGRFNPMGGGGFNPAAGGSRPPSSGGGGFSPMGGSGGPPSSGGGGFSPKGGGAMTPGGLGPMGGGAMTPGRTGPTGGGFVPGQSSGSSRPTGSSLHANFIGKVIYITLDAEITSDTDRKIRQQVENQVVRLKGMTDVAANPQPRWHELARTALTARNQNRVLRGTHALAEDAGGKSFLSRGPNQRVSWMVDLLPMLGKSDIYNEIDPKLPWRDEKNLRAGANWVPEFLNPQYPRDKWQARLPSLPSHDLGATHYVGLSGIGLDSADWDDNNPALRKKMGLFGYNRDTKFDDIPDGASNTIYLITVPPNVPRPWIAGGGATVQGVPEKNSIAPFVYNHGGKRGAYVLMADGSVRFLSAETPDKVFQALVTKAGSDDPGDLDATAPKLPAPAAPTPKPSPRPQTSAAADAWQPYTSKDGRFSVTFPPGKIKVENQEVALPNGVRIKSTITRLDSDDGFGVAYSDLPTDVVARGNPDQMLDGSVQGFAAMVKGATIKAQKKITLGTMPGREFVLAEAGEKEVTTVRIILANNRLYQVIAPGSKGRTPADMIKFLDSFKVTN